MPWKVSGEKAQGDCSRSERAGRFGSRLTDCDEELARLSDEDGITMGG